MKQSILWLALLCVGLSFLLAQTPQIEWGPYSFLQNTETITHIAGVTSKGFYTYNLTYYLWMPITREKSVKLKRYNHDMVQIKYEDIRLKYNGIYRSFERFLLLDEQLFMFTSYKNKSRSEHILLVETIDLNTLSSKGNPVEISSIPLPEKSRWGKFEIKISRDSSKVLINTKNPRSQDQKEIISFSVFDSHLEELWTLQETLPYEDYRFDMSDIEISNMGEVILSGIRTELEFETRFNEKISMKEVHFWVYLNQGTERQQYVVELDDRKITAIEIELSAKGELICGGFYRDGGKGGVDGTFLLRYDTKTEDLLAETYSPFDNNILVDMIGKNAAKKNYSPVRYKLDDMILKQDGGIILVAEESYSSYSSVDRNSYFHYGDILVASLDSKGAVEWYKLIKKRQVEPNRVKFGSYKMMIMPDRLCFIFNDNKSKESVDKKITINIISRKNIVVSLVTISLDGNIKKEHLIDSTDEWGFSTPILSFQYNNREMLLRAEKGQSSRYARVIF